MNVLIGCEFSGVVRDAFRARGHNAYSCDLLASTDNRFHLQMDLNYVLNYPDRCLVGHPAYRLKWDLLIAHPPCTYLANSGVRWLYGGKGHTPDESRWDAMRQAATFFVLCWEARRRIPRVAVENPILHRHAAMEIFGDDDPTPTQRIQPWQFGHPETKATCLWLSGLPKLEPTKIVPGRKPRVHRESPGPDRWKRRSITYQGIADAMADQWGME